MKKNMTLSFMAKFVAIVTGLVVQRQILLAFGSSYNGLTSSIAQIMSYLALLEAGLGAASIQALYEPLAKRDSAGISGIFTATGKEYRKISCLFLILLVGVSLLLPLAVSDEIDYITAGLLTLVTGGSSVMSYVIGGKYKTLLTADGKIYILYLLDIITIILSCVFRVAALNWGFGIVFVQLINLCTVGIKNIGYVGYIKLKYNFLDYEAKPTMHAIEKRWNVLVHQIAGIVVNHTDVTILTIFSSLKLVSVYSVYNMIFGQMSTLLSSVFSQAPQATFGRLFFNNKEEFNKFYKSYETIFIVMLYTLASITLVMILPFVSVYTKSIEDISYIDSWLPVLFTAILLMNQIRTPAIIAINVAGTFKETQKGAILEAVINIVVSLSLFFFTKLGLYGLLIGTVCSYIYRTFDVVVYVYKNILCEKMGHMVKLLLVNTIGIVCVYLIFCVFFSINVDSFYLWILWAIFVSICSLLLFVFINLITNKTYFLAGVQYLVRRLEKNRIGKVFE